jgi:CRP-like cAMP-binding protein
MNVIFEYLNKILPISEKEIEELTPLLRTKTLLKDEFLLNQNQTCNFLAFIKEGSFRSFHVNSNGNSTNIMLTPMNEFISEYESYLTGLPANISIQSIKKSEVIIIYKKDLNKLLENSLYWNKLGLKLTENIFILSKLRLESIIYQTPEERYLDLITNSPDFLEKFSLTDISSFIGVTLQSLSRIRARI